MTITASILADSVSAHSGKRLTSFLLRYPRFIHGEVMTHRVFARNASSSRAIPIPKMLSTLREDPAMPERWGLNGKGMQDHGPLETAQEEEAKRLWLLARDNTITTVSKMLAMEQVPHKQIVNRLLEPWMHIDVVVTATELANWFTLRRHADADPTIEVLANHMFGVMKASEPTELRHGQWHLPFIKVEDRILAREYLNELGTPATSEADITQVLLKMSTARCARTSYGMHDGKSPSVTKDFILHDLLVKSDPKHASPAEHQATPDTGGMVFSNKKQKNVWTWDNPELHGPLNGFCQYRKTIPGENAATYDWEGA